jgi:hypothetical protein
MCQKMISHCPRGNTVDLKRTWKNGVVSSFNICPIKNGTICKTSQSESKDSDGKSFLVQDSDLLWLNSWDRFVGYMAVRNTTRIYDCKEHCERL